MNIKITVTNELWSQCEVFFCALQIFFFFFLWTNFFLFHKSSASELGEIPKPMTVLKKQKKIETK